MTVLNSFELGGVRFVQDIRPGNERGKSAQNEFILVKTDAFLNFYRGLCRKEPKNILEIGMFEGGSMVFFDKLYNPQKLVGLDIRAPIPALEEYKKDKPHIATRYGTSQDDPRIADLLRNEFPDGIDLIVDDASHQYSLSRETFHICFPFLRPRGLYVIEDWSWSHKRPSQNSTHPWHDKPALTNLITELVYSLPDSRQISRMTIYRDIAVVERSEHSSGQINLDEVQERLRGRHFEMI